MIFGCLLAGALCVAAQYLIKRSFEPRQYNYARDILLSGVWLLLAIWFGSGSARFIVGAGFMAGTFGLAENCDDNPLWRLGYPVIGLACAAFGHSISFISFTDGEYIYLSPLMSFVITSLWFSVFPLVIQRMDGVSGLAGHILAVAFSLMFMSVFLSGQDMPDAFFMSFAGIVLLSSFWSRFNNVYRQAGRSMSAMWGTLVAGTAMLGVSKGIVFSSMLCLSLGLFAIPLAEVSLNLVNLAFSENAYGTTGLYRRLIHMGFDHPDAVRLIAGLCALCGAVTALSQYSTYGAAAALCALVSAAAFAAVLHLWFRRKNTSPISGVKPCLWGVYIDNMSMNYALARARGLINGYQVSESGRPKVTHTMLVSTVNALGMDEAVRDREYHKALTSSVIVLSDGVGLLWALRFLGMPIQERVTGIDFAEQLCRMAAVERWPVYFLGSKGSTAKDCADALSAKYDGLVVAGARDGYFDINDTSVPDGVAHSGAKILFVAMGIPRQEKWVSRHASRLKNVLSVGVGGAFDVLSGRLRRAPLKMQRFGLEWLFRLVQEPERWKKDLRLVSFVFRVLSTRLGLYRGGESR
ncbi:WecB/TagA/CpsF family glycosyl transferase [Synergistales bacterium]|nr:WecB/TagA/CpsF family glycosyl transferase [Synergistales bacterium]